MLQTIQLTAGHQVYEKENMDISIMLLKHLVPISDVPRCPTCIRMLIYLGLKVNGKVKYESINTKASKYLKSNIYFP